MKNHEEQNRPSVSRNGLQTLREALGLNGHLSDSTAWSDSVLIAIDFENTGNIRDGFLSSIDCQVGLAILDVRDLGRDIRPGRRLIKTHNFVTGSPSYINRASRKFIFGKTIVTKPAKILKRIESVIPQDRHVILLGHSVRNELEMLRILGFRFVPSISIIDTVRVANEVFGFWGGSLGDLLGYLGCAFSNLHSGGNDASFTLRASLLLACRKCEDTDQATSNTLEQIATSSIPYRIDPEVKAAMKKEKRQAKTRKYQAKFRTVEEQNQIRAERAVRRAELRPVTAYGRIRLPNH